MTVTYLESELVSRYPGFKIAYSTINNINNTQESPEVTKLIETLPNYVKANEKELLSRADHMKHFYKRIGSKNRYHILSLLKSTLNGRNYQPSNPSVDLVYGIELQNGILMGLHDLDKIPKDIYVGVAKGLETLDHISQGNLTLAEGAIILKNGKTVMASLSDGPDKQTKVTETSQNILVVAFGAPEDSLASLLSAIQQTNQIFRDYKLGEPENIDTKIA